MIKLFNEWLNEGFDLDVNNSDKHTITIDDNTVNDNSKIPSFKKYVKKIEKNIKKIFDSTIERISGDYEEFEDAISDNYDLIRMNKESKLYKHIENKKVKYVDLSKIINDKYKKIFELCSKRSKVGKGEILLPMLFSDVYKCEPDKSSDCYLKHNDEIFDIELKSNLQGSWDNCVPKQIKTFFNENTYDIYKKFICETFIKYCDSRKKTNKNDNTLLCFFDIKLRGLLIINMNQTQESLEKIFMSLIEILNNGVAGSNKNFDSYCDNGKIICALPSRNFENPDDFISVKSYVEGKSNKLTQKSIQKNKSYTDDIIEKKDKLNKEYIENIIKNNKDKTAEDIKKEFNLKLSPSTIYEYGKRIGIILKETNKKEYTPEEQDNILKDVIIKKDIDEYNNLSSEEKLLIRYKLKYNYGDTEMSRQEGITYDKNKVKNTFKNLKNKDIINKIIQDNKIYN